MAKNQSEFYVHLYNESTGETESVAPGEDLPSWGKVTNPYVLGKADEDDSDDPETPKRGRPRKAADAS